MTMDKDKDKNNNNVVAFEQTKRNRQKQNGNGAAVSVDAQKKPAKRRRNRPDLANFGQEYVEPGDNAKYIEFALASWNMPKVNLDSDDEVEERINWYFKRCLENDMKPGVVGLANALGVTRQTLWNWQNGTVRANGRRFDLIKKAYGFLEELWEDYMMNGKVSPPNGIFLGKNHFNYKDVQNVVIAPQNNGEQDMSADDIAKRYLEDGKTVETGFADGDGE